MTDKKTVRHEKGQRGSTGSRDRAGRIASRYAGVFESKNLKRLLVELCADLAFNELPRIRTVMTNELN